LHLDPKLCPGAGDQINEGFVHVGCFARKTVELEVGRGDVSGAPQLLLLRGRSRCGALL